MVVFANKDDKVGLAVGVTDNLTSKFDAVQFVKVGSEIIGAKVVEEEKILLKLVVRISQK